MKTKKCFEGQKKCIELLYEEDSSCQTDNFLNSLDPKDRRKVDVLFELMGEKGSISNKEKFKKLEGSEGIFEFKSFQVRLLCFMTPGRRVIVCRGLLKKKDKHDKADISFAESCRKQFLGEMM